MAENITGGGQAFESSIKIADDVIGSIAQIAALDVEGVNSMAGSAGSDLMAIMGSKAARASKGVRTVVDDGDVKLTLALVVDYGTSIPALSRMVQEKVRTTVENMTGFTVSEVNVNIAGIKVPEI